MDNLCSIYFKLISLERELLIMCRLKNIKWVCLTFLLCLGGWQSQAFALQKGQLAPDFNFTISGKEQSVKLSDYRGKVVYLDFWASWCAPCRESFPIFNQLHNDKNNKNLVIIAIGEDAKLADAEKFLAHQPVDFITYWDEKGVVAELYQPPGMPTSYLIDKEGKIHAIIQGFKKDKMPALRKNINYLLEK